MNNEFSNIARGIVDEHAFAELTVADLESFLQQHPYAGPARFLLAKKKQAGDPAEADESTVTASLYFSNPLWFQWQLDNGFELSGNQMSVAIAEPAPEMAVELHEVAPASPVAEGEAPKPVTPESKGEIAFQAYHTIDYFASQGIRLQQAEITGDKLGQQLKSFTEWLKSMKKLPSATDGGTYAPEEVDRTQFVIRSAAHSIEEKEIVTETMAEVWAKQGNTARATETYRKLSLLNPSKNAYFAAKIDQLK